MRLPFTLIACFIFVYYSGAYQELAAGGDRDGAIPRGGLTVSGSTIYGATRFGGDSNAGTLYAINTDGTGFTLLHEFTGGGDDGAYPNGGLILSGSTLYGTTVRGGGACPAGCGTIFSIGIDGSGYTLLHDFASGGTDGSFPAAGLTQSSSTLFGTTTEGGERRNEGTIFSMNTDGTGFTLLHEFGSRIPPDGGDDQGWYPSRLTVSGSTLYGTTRFGGQFDVGTLFSLNADGTGFKFLHEFARGAEEGSVPANGVDLSGSTLFGTTSIVCYETCEFGHGAIFSIGIDEPGLRLLHQFAGGISDGATPSGGLTVSGSTIYGATRLGGDSNAGTLYAINTDGTGFTLLHDFTGGGDDGASPNGGLILSGSTLYGNTEFGGNHNLGTIFSLNTDGTGFKLLHEFAGNFIPEPSSLVLLLAGALLPIGMQFARRIRHGQLELQDRYSHGLRSSRGDRIRTYDLLVPNQTR